MLGLCAYSASRLAFDVIDKAAPAGSEKVPPLLPPVPIAGAAPSRSPEASGTRPLPPSIASEMEEPHSVGDASGVSPIDPEFLWLFNPGSGSIFSAYDPDTIECPWRPSKDGLRSIIGDERFTGMLGSLVDCAWGDVEIRDLYRRYLELGLACLAADRLPYAEQEERRRLVRSMDTLLQHEELDTAEVMWALTVLAVEEDEGQRAVFREAVRARQDVVESAMDKRLAEVCE